ncbi:DUF3604 domain-containing protein [Nocardioides sp.]|uniref:DUF3604 domain-containing protein n=1 Tax=Nocardioides sp. TaxID=35761 RepID=UPI003D0D4BF7
MSDHGHSHGGHSHAAMCGGLDHHGGDYTPQQRADLDQVLAFNRRMADAINDSLDTHDATLFLDPDPLRYMWVDEGQGQISRVISEADELLTGAPRIDGHVRGEVSVVEGSRHAARPTVATGPGGERLVAWVEWIPQQGDVVQVALDGAEPVVVSSGIADVFRPTAAISTGGVPWVFYGARAISGSGVGVWATRLLGSGWTAPELVSGSEQPAFNQEVVAHADGRIELVWQGRDKDRFGVFSRSFSGNTWDAPRLVTAGVDANVWDPSAAAFADGSTAYAWSEYREGAYRVVVRRRDAAGRLTEPRDLTRGNDYALHPHLAVTLDQQLWCAFDVITVAGHGGSGPTKLRPAAELGDDHDHIDGMREAGESIPPELLPEVTASIRVVNIADDGLRQAPGTLADRLNVVPSGLPKLVATADGGLTVAYRVHRQLPLMTYYWEVATQALGPDGWLPASTYRDTDGTLEEVSVAATGDGVLLAAQTDARLERALQWTEGFGGRECPYLLEHQGSVIWHGIHGVGTIVTAQAPSGGPVPTPEALAFWAEPEGVVVADDRTEARRWVSEQERERYHAQVGDRDFTLYWGDLHRHSLVSRCTAGDEPSLDDFYRYAWDVCEYDFWAVTDHSENSSDYQWWSIQKIADLFHVPDRFVPLYGFEWTSADSGHQNVIFGDVERGAPIFSAFAEGTTDPDGLWEALAQHPDFPAITIPHHPGSAMVHNDWDYHDPRFSKLVEIFQACRGNYEGPGCFRQYSDGTREGTFTIDGLQRGHRFGLIASSDHGHGASYVGAFATSLDRAEVFEALQARRTFAATTRDVIVDFQAGDVFMGEEAPAGAERAFRIHARGYAELARVDIVRDGEVVHALLPSPDVEPGWITVPLRLEWGGAEVSTVWDGQLTVSGGRVVQTDFWSPEVSAASDDRVSWLCTTHSFGEPYGAQRGGIELTVVGAPEAVVSVSVGESTESWTLADLVAGAHDMAVPHGTFAVQPGIGGLIGLGTHRVDVEWHDPDPSDGESFYYARVFQVDGEMAWSSPIWMV